MYIMNSVSVCNCEDSLWGTTSDWAQANYYSGGGYWDPCAVLNITRGQFLPLTCITTMLHGQSWILPMELQEVIPVPESAGEIYSYSYTYTLPVDWNLTKSISSVFSWTIPQERS